MFNGIQILTQSIEKGKGDIEKRGSIEKESKELWMAVEENYVKKVKSHLKRGIADVDWKNPDAVRIFFLLILLY